jgi:hypothetical protein
MRGSAVATVLAAAFALAGCRSCRNEHPYVPFSIGDGDLPTGTQPEGDAAEPVEADAGPVLEEALVAPPMTTSWNVGGATLKAPDGRLFAFGLVHDFDGDGKLDAFAVLFAASGRELGQVVFYRGQDGGRAAPTVLLSSPEPLDSSCSPTPRLARIGKSSVEAELAAKCTGHTRPPARAFAILTAASAASPEHVRLGLKVTDPPGTPPLRLDADGSDRDGDGVEDVNLTVTVQGGTAPFEPGPKVSAQLRFFDRPAGLSRDPDEPDASLRALAGGASLKAVRAKDAPSVPLLVRQIGFLYSAMCTEGGAPRLLPTSGAGEIACGPSHALEEAGFAEMRSYLTGGDTLRAAFALDGAQMPPATRTPQRLVEAGNWMKQVAPPIEAASVRQVGARPKAGDAHGASYAPLSFDAAGKLLVETDAGVVRVDPVQGDEADASDVQPWNLDVVGPAGGRLTGASVECSTGAVHATIQGDGALSVVPLPVSFLRLSHCGSGSAPLPVLPLAWGAGGLEVVVAGQALLVENDRSHASLLAAQIEQKPPRGSPRSADGAVTVVPSALGLVIGGARKRLLTSKDLPYGDAQDCVVNPDATRVACSLPNGRTRKVVVGVWPL